VALLRVEKGRRTLSPVAFGDPATLRIGDPVAIIGSPFGDPPFAYYAEFEWADMDAFNAAVRSEEFAASGKDAMAMGIPFTVAFAEIAE